MAKTFERVQTFLTPEDDLFKVSESDSTEVQIVVIHVNGRKYVILPTHRFCDFTIQAIDGHAIKTVPVHEALIEIGTERPKK